MTVIQAPKRKKTRNAKTFWLTTMMVPVTVWLLLLRYLPMFGIVLSFLNYRLPTRKLPFPTNLFKSPWVGLKNFSFLFTGESITMIRNTIGYNALWITLGLIIAVTFAIMMSELTRKFLAKTYQTLMFFPYFLSWVVVGAILYGFLTSNFRVDRKTGELIVTGANGIVNRLIMGAGGTPVRWYAEAKYWKTIIILLDVWKWAGYNSIIYMAAMVGFDGSLYEAATIDGASRFQQIRYLTVPMLKPTVVTLTLMSIGRIFYGDMGMIWGLVGQNATVLDAVTVIDTYVYTSMRTMGMGFSTAVGLCQGLMGLILILLANTLAKKINDGEGLF